ncbi:MAG: DNA polymerase III subunit chi [Gammaproteobacteria bacterium]|nr:DNA polymerase III subunit chi [Gammaproteobacteria bacterium]
MSDAKPRIDFYVLPDATRGTRLRFACRLTEKAYKLDNRTYAHVEGAAQARELDELLWTFRAGSFVPHEITSTENPVAPVTIGHDNKAKIDGDLLINLAEEIPPFFDQFARIAEIIDASDDGRQLGRQRFSFYRDNGYEPNTHKL